MLLDIVVPHSKESWDVVRPFFDVIHSQKGINFDDFRVTLVHDGVLAFPEHYLHGPAHVRQVCLSKGGVSKARNYGIDHSEAEWINFCDCDDCFSSIFSLYMVFHALRNSPNFDVLWNQFYIVNGDQLKIQKDYSPVFIHNKYYRLDFLKRQEIRFCEKLYMSEDSAFNAIIWSRLEQGRLGQINSTDPLYSWCRRPGSISLDPSRWMINAEGHFERNLYVLEEYMRRGDEMSRVLMIGRTLTDAYAQMMCQRAQGDPGPFRKKVAAFYRENMESFQKIPKEKLEPLLAISDLEAGTSEECKKSRPELTEWLCDVLKE